MIFKGLEAISAITFYCIVKKYAQANGMPFWLAKDQRKAIEHYVTTAQLLN